MATTVSFWLEQTFLLNRLNSGPQVLLCERRRHTAGFLVSRVTVGARVWDSDRILNLSRNLRTWGIRTNVIPTLPRMHPTPQTGLYEDWSRFMAVYRRALQVWTHTCRKIRPSQSRNTLRFFLSPVKEHSWTWVMLQEVSSFHPLSGRSLMPVSNMMLVRTLRKTNFISWKP